MKYVWYKTGEKLLDELQKTDMKPRENSVEFWYIGQMGLIVKAGGIMICFDPVLNDLFYPDKTSRRNYPQPFEGGRLTGVDYVVCSHNHADHMNLETLIPLHKANPKAKFIVPVPETHILTEGGIMPGCVIGGRNMEVIGLEEKARLTPIASAHETYVTDETGDHKYLGYMLEINGVRIYHAGDTVFTEQLVADVNLCGPIDIACLPINGTGGEFHNRGVIGNMDAKDAAYFALRIDADMTVPLHFDMVVKNEGSPLIFAYYMQKLAAGKKYHVMQLGERFVYCK